MRATALLSSMALLISGFASSSLLADPLDGKQVAAGAKWVIHVDLDAARASTALKKGYQAKMKSDKAKARLEKATKTLGLNPVKDVKSLTAYDTQFKIHSGVAIIEVNNLNREKLTSLFEKKHPDHKKTKAGKHTICSWSMHKHEVSGAFYGDRHIVMGNSVDAVKAAIAVLDGKAKSLAKGSSLAAAAPQGTILWMAADGIAGSETPFHSKLIKNSERLSAAMGENGGKLFYSGSLTTDSAEAANNVKAIVEGFRALIRLNHGKDTNTAKILDGLKVSTQGKTISGQWSAEVDVVIAAAKAARKAHGKLHHRLHRHHHHHGDKKKKSTDKKKK